MKRTPAILLTGFSSFPGAPFNPTRDIIHQMRLDKAEMPASVVFPVSYRIVTRYLDRILDITRPDIIISLGLSYEAEGFVLEQRAYNETDTDNVDIFDTISGSCIVENAAPCHTSRVPLAELEKTLKNKNTKSCVSDDPGRYLCNYLYYTIMEKQKEDPSKWSCFIHVPPLREQCAQIIEASPDTDFHYSITSEALKKGINQIIKCLHHEWGKIYG